MLIQKILIIMYVILHANIIKMDNSNIVYLNVLEIIHFM